MTDARQVRAWLAEAASVITRIDANAVAAAVSALAAVREAGGMIFIAGNGGSASTASHMALDLQKAARPDGRGTRAIAICDNVGLVTAWGNDASFERVFAEQIAALAQPGDALVVISVSGSSPNLTAALEAARERRMVTVGLLGKDGGAQRARLDHAVVVPSGDYGWVESAHVVLEHVVTYSLRAAAVTA